MNSKFQPAADGPIVIQTTMSDFRKENSKSSTLPGLAAVGLMITGVAGIHHAYSTGSGVGLIASAISFGCILVVMFL